MPKTLKRNKILFRYIKFLIVASLLTVSCNTHAQKANGYQIDYYITGVKKSEGNYKNSKQDSTWKYYFPNGEINRITNYNNGIKNGRSLSYNKGGKLASDVNYKNGKFYDTIKFYYPNGQLNFEDYYDENGLSQGDFKVWFQTGKLRQYGHKINGKIIGKSLEYYENGQIKEIDFYDTLGRKDSTWSYYSGEGILIRTEKYKADSLLKTMMSIK